MVSKPRSELRAFRIAGIQYASQYQSLYEWVAAIEALYRTRRVPYPDMPVAPTLPVQPASSIQPVSLPVQQYHPDHITHEKGQFCTREVIVKCYDYLSADPNGRIDRYHGDLYRSCNGQLVLITHLATRK